MSNVYKKLLVAAGVAAAALLATAAAPEGWYLAGSKPANYDTGVDRDTVFNAKPSAYLKAKADQEGFGTLMQDFSADQYVGKRVRLSAFVKSGNVTRWAGLWMRVDGMPKAPSLAFDNMQDRPIKGTTEWRRYEVVLDVPRGATGIFFGILLDGPGEVWLNSTNIEVVGTNVPVTGHARLEAPQNLGFDR